MKRWLPIVLIAAGILGLVYALFFWSTDEDLIRGKLAQLADAVRVTEDERNPLVRLGRVRQAFSEVFTKEATAAVPEHGEALHGRDALVQAAVGIGNIYQSADVSYSDMDLRIDPGGISAGVTCSATLTGARHGQPIQRDDRRVRFQLEKIDGDWKIVSVSITSGEPGGEDDP